MSHSISTSEIHISPITNPTPTKDESKSFTGHPNYGDNGGQPGTENIDVCYIPPLQLKPCTEGCKASQVRCMSECNVHADECGIPYTVKCSSGCTNGLGYCMDYDSRQQELPPVKWNKAHSSKHMVYTPVYVIMTTQIAQINVNLQLYITLKLTQASQWEAVGPFTIVAPYHKKISGPLVIMADEA
ncbi:unnamed protein product [Dicrocoelium dendriticum]|nr:unnamed protein product [Dicrocoelium dendriticum]